MLITTDMKVVDLLQRHQKEFLNAAYASPQLYPITHDREVLFETFSLFATIFPEGTLADLLDFMVGSRASSEARQAAFARLAEKREHHAQVERARELAGRNVFENVRLEKLTDKELLAEVAAKGFKSDPAVIVVDDLVEAECPPGPVVFIPHEQQGTDHDPVEELPANIREKVQEYFQELVAPESIKPAAQNPFANLASKR
jgi:hypothetical protein